MDTIHHHLPWWILIDNYLLALLSQHVPTLGLSHPQHKIPDLLEKGGYTGHPLIRVLYVSYVKLRRVKILEQQSFSSSFSRKLYQLAKQKHKFILTSISPFQLPIKTTNARIRDDVAITSQTK